MSYIYDDTGRVIAVIDPAGDTAVYSYDAVGNLLAIDRRSSALLSVIEFTPKSGPIGTAVTVSGTGFSPTATDNIVQVNGVAAAVTAASATQLTVTVPGGATTGPISVTVASGTASSASAFTVTTAGTPAGAPTVTGFTPTVGAPGTAVTVSGTNFATPAGHNRVAFNTGQAAVSAATPTSLTTSVSAAATSGPLAVTTPAGTGTSATDFFVPPAPYTASAVAVTSRLTFGQSQTLTLPTANTIALLIVNASAGHRLGLNLTTVTISSSAVSILDPYGQVVASATVSTSGAFLDTPTLTVSGTYTVVVDPVGTATGSMTLTLYDIADLTGPITSGTAVTLTFATPGQNAALTFNATAGQRVSVVVSSSTVGACSSGRFSFRESDGTPWIETSLSFGSTVYTPIGGTPCTNTFMDAKAFMQTGSYQLVLDPAAGNTGQLTLTLYLFDDVGEPLTPGTPKNLTLTTPGQNAKLTVANTAGQRVFVAVTATTLPTAVSHALVLLKPDGSQIGTSLCAGCFLDTTTIPTAGTTTLWLNPGGTSTGSISVTLYAVTDVTGTITPGTATEVTIATPGQNAVLTFAATSGQRASVRVNSSTITGPGGAGVVLRRPDGTYLASISTTQSSFLDAVTLPVTGTYILEVDPYGGNTGQGTVTLYVFADVTGTITIGGPAVPVTITTPGQRALLTFAGTAGQQVSRHARNNTTGQVALRLLDPNNTLLSSLWSSGATIDETSPQTLPVTGTYTFVVDPANPLPINTGSIDVHLTSP